MSFAFGVNHGRTRRGALVFDVADLVKDAVVMPAAFKGFAEAENASKNRHRVLEALERAKALKGMLGMSDVIAMLAQQPPSEATRPLET